MDDSWARKKEEQFNYRKFIDSELSRNLPFAKWISVSLTFKKGRKLSEDRWEYIDHRKVSLCNRNFLNRINREYYNHAYSRHGKQLARVPVIETSKKNERLHTHMLLQVPQYMEERQEEYFGFLIDAWKKVDWGYEQVTFKRLPTFQDVIRCTKYITKDLPVDERSLDVENLYLGNRT